MSGGEYGKENAMITGSIINLDIVEAKPEDCPGEGQTYIAPNCYDDRYDMIGLNDFTGWATSSDADGKTYTVASGTAEQPITIMDYPGEYPVLDVTDFTKTGCSIGILNKSFWIIDGLEMIGGGVCLGMNSSRDSSHDITIRNNDIHDIYYSGRGNHGIIRMPAGKSPEEPHYNIFIHNNKLHGMHAIYYGYDEGWNNISDQIHYGAITYVAGNHDYIEIIGNEIYNVPQAFFFKNHTPGPIKIENNIIHDSESIGKLHAERVIMNNNLVYGIKKGWLASDEHGSQRVVMENNTFVGLNSLFTMWSDGEHQFKNNVFFGLEGMPGPGSNVPSYIKSSRGTDSPTLADSFLHKINSDNNCFISAQEGFLFVYREGELYTKDEAQDVFGYDLNSKFLIESDTVKIFQNPAINNFQFKIANTCADMGVDFKKLPEVSPLDHSADYDGDYAESPSLPEIPKDRVSDEPQKIGATYYIAVDGDDKDPGSIDAPFKTFKKVFDFDKNSIFKVESDPKVIFQDPIANDYTLIPSGPCQGKGFQL